MNFTKLPRLLILLLPVALAGCAPFRSPTIDVLGSYFPAWMVCIVCGLGLTVVTRLLFIAARLRVYPAPIIYPCLMAFFTLSVWLIFFRN